MLLFYHEAILENGVEMRVNSTNNSVDGNSSGSYLIGLGSSSGSSSGSGSADGMDEEVTPASTEVTPADTEETVYYDDVLKTYSNISIHLPPTVFANVTDASVGVLFSFYTTSALFPARRANDSDFPYVVSPVIGASLAGVNSSVNLSQQVVMTIPFSKVLCI